MESGELIRFERQFEETGVRGYVLDVGAKFFLLQLVSDRIRFDGFECFRISDVRGLQPDPHAGFVEAALAKREPPRPPHPAIDLSSVERMILTAGSAFQLVAVHTELADPDVCWIGQVAHARRGKVWLREIGPDAVWHDDLRPHRVGAITRLSFGGDYEGALELVAEAPRSDLNHDWRSVLVH
jgi:hypothetical protein